MKPYISAEMQSFLTPSSNEEAVDQPLYHVQSYGTAGATTFTFFDTIGANLSVNNMDVAKALSKGKRFAIFSIGVAFLPGQNPVQATADTTLSSALNDAKRVLEGAAVLELKVLDKVYLTESPLTRVPAGMGLHTGAGGIQRTQASAADGTFQASYGSNGLPQIECKRKLRVPIPIPEQVQFTVRISYPTAVTVAAIGSIGVWLDGMLIRARQ